MAPPTRGALSVSATSLLCYHSIIMLHALLHVLPTPKLAVGQSGGSVFLSTQIQRHPAHLRVYVYNLHPTPDAMYGRVAMGSLDNVTGFSFLSTYR